MKRGPALIALPLLGLILVWSCGQTPLPPPANLVGTYELAMVSKLLFVTSTERDELKVLDLNPNPNDSSAPREFVRAPNPLERLSIPVVKRPVALTRDDHYVYAASASEMAISVVEVGVDGGVLRELGRISTGTVIDPAAGADAGVGAGADGGNAGRIIRGGLVTALSAVPPTTQGGASPNRVYYAILDSESGVGKVYRSNLEAASPDGGFVSTLRPDGGFDSTELPIGLSPGETVSALLVLPTDTRPDPNTDTLVVGTRTGHDAGSTFLYTASEDAGVGTGARGPSFDFNSAVRQLVSHGRYPLYPAAGETYPDGGLVPADGPAGKFVFGILDESVCPSATACSGVRAVDVSGASTAPPSTVLSSTFLSNVVSGTLPISLAVAPGGTAPAQVDGARVTKSYPLLGLLSDSSGRVFLFDLSDPTKAMSPIAINNVPVLFQPDPVYCGSCTLGVPGAVIYRPEDATGYVAFPSDNAIVEFVPAGLPAGTVMPTYRTYR